MDNNAFNALANDHRRKLLVALLEEKRQPDHVQRLTNGGAGVVQTKQEEKIRLYHQHLPKLVDYGIIDWDKEAHEISRGPQFEEIRPLLEFIRAQP